MRRLGMHAIGALFALSLAGHGSAAVPPEPGGPHPRLFHEPGTAEALRAAAAVRGSATARAVANCRRIAASPAEYARDGYMGLDWARSLQTCLVAWRATGEERHADTALIYFRALLDDLTMVGDGEGGDESARRDSGYAIRALGPYTALAYDWLHARMDEPLRARARQRFAAWTRWYTRDGYRAHAPGNNYHAGYVAAAALIAVAQGSEAGEEGARLWREVAEETFGAELLPAARDGVLAGGDWGEGWQYGPLSVANYALAARAVAPYGIDVAPMGRWLEEVFVRHAHAMTPTGQRTLVVGDTQSESPHIPVRRETLESVVFGPAPERAREWARAELARIGDLADDDLGYLLFGALAEATPGAAVPFPRERLPGAWFARGTSILYARTRWDERAAWFAAFCSPTIDVDHLPANAGNFVLSRGADHGIVDPSPYGSLSSLTSNAPAADAPDQPPGYSPGQSYWSVETGFAWKRRLADGALFARCDWADQYRFREVPSPIRTAWRDFVFLPWPVDGGADGATLLVVDRVRTREPADGLHLRFRTQADLEPAGAGADARIGDSRLSILRLAASGGEVEVRALPAGDCFGEDTTRGGCDASRFAAHEVRTVVPGTEARAAFEIDLGPKASSTAIPKAAALVAEGGGAWLLARGKRRWVVVAADGAEGVRYAAPAAPALHVALPGTVGGSASVRVAATRVLDDCRVVVGGAEGTSLPGTPALFTLDADCTVRPAPAQDVPQDVTGLLGDMRP